MSLIVENGAGLSGSESYATVASADIYCSSRGLSDWASISTSEKEQALRRACDYIGQTYRSQFAGRRVSDAQALDFPRYDVPRVDGVSSYYPSDSIPKELVTANIELAIRAAAGELLSDIDPEIASEKVSSIETHYFKGSSKIKKFPAIDKLLSVFLSGGGASVVRFVRA